MNIHPKGSRLACLLAHLLCSLLFAATLQAAPKWEPIAPADLQATQCPQAADAKAEILFIHEEIDADWRRYHQRTKIYNKDALADQGLISVNYYSGERIVELAARIVKPDGSATEFSKKDFTETTLAKSRDGRLRRLTATFPDIQAGDIIELRWTKSEELESSTYLWNWLQYSVPTREYIVTIKSLPLNYSGGFENCPQAKVVKNSQGQNTIVANNIPAYEEEPLGPPSRDVRGWYAIYLQHPYWRHDTQKEIMDQLSDFWQDDFKLRTKPNTPIKQLAAQLTKDVTDPEEKLARLYDWCRREIHNLTYFRNAELEKLKAKRDGNETWGATDTFAKKAGFANDVTWLFASLARAAGFETRLMLAASRNLRMRVSSANSYYYLNDQFVGVKIGDKWKPYCPGDYHVQPGMVHGYNETVPFLMCEGGKAKLATLPPSRMADTSLLRKARLSLDEEGNLEGEIELTYTGHEASQLKQKHHGNSQEETDTEFRRALTARLTSAEVGSLKWTNLEGTGTPVVCSFHVRVPGYAELLGERLAAVPSFFTKNEGLTFTAPTRSSHIFLPYPETVQDDIEIVLPENYTLEPSAAPENHIDQSGLLSTSYRIGYKRKSRTLVYKRSLEQAKAGDTIFSPAIYPGLKAHYERIHKSDNHTLMFGPSPAEAQTTQAPAAAAGETPKPAI